MPDLSGGGGDDLFYEARRVCNRCATRVDRPEFVHYGPGDVYEEHTCPDGGIGRLRLLYPPPPPGDPPADPLIVSF